MTTRVTEGARRERHDKRASSFLASRDFAAQRSALPLLNLKKKRDCSQVSSAFGERRFVSSCQGNN